MLEDRIYTFTMAVLLLGFGCFFWYMAGKCRHGTLPFGSRLGNRSRATLASRDAWRAGHIAMTPFLRVLSVLAVLLALVCAFAGGLISGPVPLTGFVWVLVLIYLLAVLALGGAGLARSNRAARAAGDDSAA